MHVAVVGTHQPCFQGRGDTHADLGAEPFAFGLHSILTKYHLEQRLLRSKKAVTLARRSFERLLADARRKSYAEPRFPGEEMTEEKLPSENSTIVRSREALPADKPRRTHWLVQRCPWLGTRLLAELCLAPRVRLPALGALPGVTHRELRVGKRSVRLHLLGEGPRVVFAHGWQGAASQLVTLAHSVVAAGFSVTLFDMPAHGEASGWSTSGVEFTRVLQHIGAELGPLHAIVGHSLGGTAALLASARGLPSAGVVALAPLPSFDFALRHYARAYGLPPRAKELLARRLEARTGIKRTEMDLALLRPPAPALLVHDLLDRVVPPRHSRRLRDAWPGAHLFETLGLGHHRGLQTEHVAQAIVAFLLSLPAVS